MAVTRKVVGLVVRWCGGEVVVWWWREVDLCEAGLGEREWEGRCGLYVYPATARAA